MRKTMTCVGALLYRKKWLEDDFEDRAGEFRFSMIDASAIPGSPRDYCVVRAKITGELLMRWRLIRISEDDLTRVLFWYASEHVRQRLEGGAQLPTGEELILETRDHSEARCPVEVSDIDKVVGFSFDVRVREPSDEVVDHSLEGCLQDFAKHVQCDERMTFWQPGNTTNRKWISRPEKHAKNLLRTFLKGRFEDRIYTFDEITSGAGKVDLLIVSPNAEQAVVELKMCGHGYSLTYAQEGNEQLVHYMENRGTKSGYLVVFDSRARDFARGFPKTGTIGRVPFVNIVIDVRPYVKPRQAPE